MQKFKKIIIISGILLLFSAAGFFLTRTKEAQLQPGQKTPLPQTQIPYAELKLPTGDTMSASGIEVKNVYKTAVDINTSGDVVFAETIDYQEIYHPKDDYFLISVINSPFSEAKIAAEQQFLRSLGISESEACKLNVNVTTPRYANPNESGKNYKLSFCE